MSEQALNDPFDVAALRLPPSFEQDASVTTHLSTVPVRKPSKQEWIRVHPDAEYRGDFATINLKDKSEHYLVAPKLIPDLAKELSYVTIYTVINKAGVAFLWPCRIPNQNRRVDLWASSAHECAEAAMKQLVRIQSNRDLGAYEYATTGSAHAEPVWPDKTFADLLKIGFQKSGLFVDSLDHPVVRHLLGNA
jgi:hypothetical protein